MCYVSLSQIFILLPGPVMQDRRYRVVSLFSGIAGLELGLRQSCTQELSSYFLANKTYHHILLKDDSNSVPTSRCYYSNQKHLVWSQVLRTLRIRQILSF